MTITLAPMVLEDGAEVTVAVEDNQYMYSWLYHNGQLLYDCDYESDPLAFLDFNERTGPGWKADLDEGSLE